MLYLCETAVLLYNKIYFNTFSHKYTFLKRHYNVICYDGVPYNPNKRYLTKTNFTTFPTCKE